MASAAKARARQTNPAEPARDPQDRAAERGHQRPRFWATPRGALALGLLAVAMALFMVQMHQRLLAAERASVGYATNLRQGGDSYVYWFALRALRDGRDPYSPAVTREIQQAILATPEPQRLVPPSWQAFVYPLPVLAWYLPTLGLPLDGAAQYGRLLGLVAVLPALALGLRLARLPLTGWPAAAGAALLAGQTAVYEQYALGQNTALFLALALAAAALYAQRRYGPAGALLALALMKPQYALVLALGLGLHALVDRRRWGFFLGAAAAGLGACGLGLLVAPSWLADWLDNLGRYGSYNVDFLQALVGGQPLAATLVRAALILPVLGWWWAHHRQTGGDWLLVAVAASLVSALLAFSNVVAYNLLLLWPALLALLLDPSARPVGLLGRLALALNVGLLLLTGVAAGLLALVWLTPGAANADGLTRLGQLVGSIASAQALAVACWVLERLLPAPIRTWSLPGRRA